MTEHTPYSVQIDDTWPYAVRVIRGDGSSVALQSTPPIVASRDHTAKRAYERPENAAWMQELEFFVTAANAHTALVTACKAILIDLDNGYIANESVKAERNRDRHAKAIRAALTLAGEAAS